MSTHHAVAMARTSCTVRPALAALLLALLAGTVGAQATIGSVHGTIAASDGSIPQGATVHAENLETAIRREARVDGSGVYSLLGLPPGIYTVSVRALGYRQQRSDSVRLIHGQRVQLDFTLERGAVELEPTVVQAGRALDVQRNDVSTAVLQEEIENLPLNTRNVLNLAAIAPGIRTFALEGGRSMPAAGALPVAEARFANLYVDGVDLRGVYAGGIVAGPFDGSMVPQEALREFRVYLNPYDVEFTRGGSYVMSAVTHSGSNKLEGALFGFHQDRNLVARSAVQPRKPDYLREQFGANVRGPLVRDRLFYSLSYESQVTDNYIDVNVPTPAEQPDRWSAYAGTFRSPSRLHNGLLRLTAPVASHTLDATLAVRDLSREAVFGENNLTRLVVRDGGLKGRSQLTNLQMRDTYASASLVNELSFHMLSLRNDQDIIVPGPTMLYKTVHIGNQIQPATIRDRHFRLNNRSTYTRGLHVIKGGVELSDVWPRIHRPNFSRGWFRFATDTSQLPNLAQIGMPTAGYAGRPGSSEAHAWSVGLYLQDEWRPVPRVSITAGARWDADLNTMGQNVIAPWATDTALLRVIGARYLNTGDRKNDLDNVAPRASVAWDALGDATTFLRGGYGVMYDRVPMLGSIPEARELGWTIYSVPNPGTTDPEQIRQMINAGGGTARRNLLLIKDDLETPATHQWSLGIGRRFKSNFGVNLDYIHQRVRDVYVTRLLNVAPNRFSTTYGDIVVWDDFGDARYRALLMSLTYDRHPTRVSVAYTLGNAESEFGRLNDSNYPDTTTYSMQRSEGDERHRLVVSGLTRLPFGLEASGIAIVASPRPFLVTLGPDANANGILTDDWPNGVRTHRRDGWEHWYRTLDLRVSKSIPTAGGRVSVIADIFNVFNTANYSEYQPNAAEPDYGEPTGDFARRQGQVGLRYWF
jgi:hypothetical protein